MTRELDISTRLSPALTTLVDDVDYDAIAQHKWRLNKRSGYVIRDRLAGDPPGTSRYVILHRWLLRNPTAQVDHINQNKLDNRRMNLRVCTAKENMRNRAGWGKSGLKGAVRDKGRWKARIMADGKAIHLGTFDTPEEAHACYCTAAKMMHGAFANTETKVLDVTQ